MGPLIATLSVMKERAIILCKILTESETSIAVHAPELLQIAKETLAELSDSMDPRFIGVRQTLKKIIDKIERNKP